MGSTNVLPCSCVLIMLAILTGVSGQSETTPGRTNYTRPVFLCGGEHVAESGFIASEGFPSHYKPNSKCTWYITVPEGNVVMLSFRIFDLEADPQCRYDFLEVYNGHAHTSQRLGRFCGTFRPGALISTSNKMMVEMVSDSETTGRGFIVAFSAGKPHVDEHQFCGGKLTKPQGSLHTPNWPESNYPAGISCSWHIIVPNNQVIEVSFDKFDVEPDSYCRYDYVAFFSGGESDDSKLIGKYCGDEAPEAFVSNSSELLVQFVSDLSVTGDGFMVSYSAHPRGSKPTTPERGVRPAAKPAPGPKPTKPAKPVKPVKTTPGPKPTKPAKPLKPTKPVKPTIKPDLKATAKPVVSKPTPKQTGWVMPIPRPGARPTPKPGSGAGLKPAVRPGGRNGTRTIPESGLPLCEQRCRRGGTMQSHFCNSEFVITGKVTTAVSGPGDTLLATVSLIKAYKAGSLRIQQAGQTMSVKLVSSCKRCPLIRRGANYILMGQVDAEGRGTLSPSSFTLLYKTPHQKILTNLTARPC
ncbi:procollagen C-endopeptidase enhancer 2-like [Acipenser ruthenus]|uniref:procollagen C-endopeptidase enhancer 2-like n=1 Tax=Acipenser ruthenus TaxID=7906 RepID=UPI00274187A5|nr:procollagen C-endopeptidase enhancer 2-like [Acipenser ruthenus]